MNYNNKSCNRTIFDPFFDAFFNQTKDETFGVLRMKTNILESDKAYRLFVELPGFNKEDIDISFSDGYLTIAVKTAVEAEDPEFKIIHRERFRGETSRRYYLGDVDENAITASFENGVLVVEAQKLVPEEVKPTKIVIQ